MASAAEAGLRLPPAPCDTLARRMEWWVWLLIALALLAVELFTPGGFFMLFFAIGAIASALLAAVPSPVTGSLLLQALLFLVVSLAGLVLFRNELVRRFALRGRGRAVDDLSESVAVALQDLPPGAIGKVELRGTTWSARNSGGVPLASGQRCTVERVNGLTLWVRVAADEYLAVTPAASQTAVSAATPQKESAT